MELENGSRHLLNVFALDITQKNQFHDFPCQLVCMPTNNSLCPGSVCKACSHLSGKRHAAMNKIGQNKPATTHLMEAEQLQTSVSQLSVVCRIHLILQITP